MDDFPLVINITEATIKNKYYRHVIHTTRDMQLVLMSLRPGEDIPGEIHEGTQFVRVESGQGEVTIDNIIYPLKDDTSISIPPGHWHYFKATGPDDLKLYSIYSPPEHSSTRIEFIDKNTKQKVTLKE